MLSNSPAFLNDPAAAKAWRRSESPGPGAVAAVTGTFEILQPGNLAALRRAAGLGGRLIVVVEDDGAAPSQTRRGAPAYGLSDRLDCLSLLKDVAAVIPGRPSEAVVLFQALAPYTWVGHLLEGDGPVSEAACRQASRRVEQPLLPGCRTGEIGDAAREGRTPIPLPSFYAASAPDPGAGPAPAATVNGCFDVLHVGHFEFLDAAAKLAGAPVTVLANSDASIRRYKGQGRPVFPFAFRRAALLAQRAVAEVYPFDEDEPLALLSRLKPPLHIKGGSREPERVRHEEERLREWGGRVAFCPLVEGYSTSAYLARTRQRTNPP